MPFRPLKSFLKSCLDLLKDEKAIKELQNILDQPDKEPQLIEITVNHLQKRIRTGREMRLSAQIGNYDMNFIILDLGSDVNVLTKQTWENMGSFYMVSCPISISKPAEGHPNWKAARDTCLY